MFALPHINRFTVPVSLAVIVLALVSGCASAPPSGKSGDDDPVLAGRYEQAVEARQDGQLDVAEHEFGELAGDYPDLAEPRINLALLYLDSGRPAEAEELLNNIVADHPDNAIAWNELGIVRRRGGQLQAADNAYLQAIEAKPEYSLAFRNRGVLLDLYLDRPDEALAHYERYLALAGPDEEVEAWVTELNFRLGIDPAQKETEQ